jgi:hypothetical protein
LLNMELDVQRLFGLLCTADSAASPTPPPPNLGSYTRALLVSQDRQHLLVTPCQGTISPVKKIIAQRL